MTILDVGTDAQMTEKRGSSISLIVRTKLVCTSMKGCLVLHPYFQYKSSKPFVWLLDDCILDGVG